MADELHAFDLTWRNYLPSASQFCSCFPRGRIRLEEEDILAEPAYYNDHTLHREEPLQNYTITPRDYQNDMPKFVTGNPFGTPSIKKKRSSKKKRNNRHERLPTMETDTEDTTVVGYNIEDDEHHFYNDDAECLGDDQIANLAYNKHNSSMVDQYGEEQYYENTYGPAIQEMHSPAQQQAPHIYAVKTMPSNITEFDSSLQEYDEYEEHIAPLPEQQGTSSSKPLGSTNNRRSLLSDRLDNLTEKLAFIKNNIKIRPLSIIRPNNENATTSYHNQPEEDQESLSDLDSIASQAFETTQQKRFSVNNRFRIPSLGENTPFGSEQHPFSYFTDHSTTTSNDQEEDSNALSVIDIGRKWLGI